MAAYVIANTHITDPQAMADYARRAPATVEAHGGTYRVRRPAPIALEGTWSPALTVIEFPSVAAARAWWDSPEYAALRRDHFKGATREVIIVDGVA